MTEAKLLPCPFCGLSNDHGNGVTSLRFNDQMDSRYNNHIVQCQNCGTSNSHWKYKSRKEAETAWNTRAAEPDSKKLQNQIGAVFLEREEALAKNRELREALELMVLFAEVDGCASAAAVLRASKALSRPSDDLGELCGSCKGSGCNDCGHTGKPFNAFTDSEEFADVLSRIPREPMALTPYAPLARGQEPGWECFFPHLQISGYGDTPAAAVSAALKQMKGEG